MPEIKWYHLQEGDIDRIPTSCKTWEFSHVYFNPQNSGIATNFDKFRKEFNLTVAERVIIQNPKYKAENTRFLWRSPDNAIQVLTSANPYTGENPIFDKKSEKRLIGYADYLTIKTKNQANLQKITEYVSRLDFKDEMGCIQPSADRGLMNFPLDKNIIHRSSL